MTPELREFVIELAERVPDLYNYEVDTAVQHSGFILTPSVETKILALYNQVTGSDEALNSRNP
jgi:hypothetical protein